MIIKIKKIFLFLTLGILSINAFAVRGWYTTINNNTSSTIYVYASGRDRWEQYDLDHYSITNPKEIASRQAWTFYTEDDCAKDCKAGYGGIQGLKVAQDNATNVLADVQLVCDGHEHSEVWDNHLSIKNNCYAAGSTNSRVKINNLSLNNQLYVDIIVNPAASSDL